MSDATHSARLKSGVSHVRLKLHCSHRRTRNAAASRSQGATWRRRRNTAGLSEPVRKRCQRRIRSAQRLWSRCASSWMCRPTSSIAAGNSSTVWSIPFPPRGVPQGGASNRIARNAIRNRHYENLKFLNMSRLSRIHSKPPVSPTENQPKAYETRRRIRQRLGAP